jgi:hypothetical protein
MDFIFRLSVQRMSAKPLDEMLTSENAVVIEIQKDKNQDRYRKVITVKNRPGKDEKSSREQQSSRFCGMIICSGQTVRSSSGSHFEGV